MKKILFCLLFGLLFLLTSCEFNPFKDDKGDNPIIDDDSHNGNDDDNGNNGSSNGEEIISDIQEKNEYEAKFKNNEIESGEDDLYHFYLFSKKEDSGIDKDNVIKITITFVYEKDYLNEHKALEQDEYTEDKITIKEVIYDGECYNCNGENYKYLNYSVSEGTTIDSLFYKEISYVLADREDITPEDIFRAMVSATLFDYEALGRFTILASIYYRPDIMFTKNEVISMMFHSDNQLESYFSNMDIAIEIKNVLNQLTWVRDSKEIDYQYDNKYISISMNRKLYSDEKGFMLQGYKGKEYLLNYRFYIDNLTVEMSYANISSSLGNLYAKISKAQMERIKACLRPKLKKEISVGEYVNNVRSRTRIELFEDGNVNISLIDGNKELLFSATYEIEKTKTNEYLIINKDNYKYVFELSLSGQKSFKFIQSLSNIDNQYSDYFYENVKFFYSNYE